jgi:hypothetical protein
LTCVSERASRLQRFFFICLSTFLGFSPRGTQRFRNSNCLSLVVWKVVFSFQRVFGFRRDVLKAFFFRAGRRILCHGRTCGL